MLIKLPEPKDDAAATAALLIVAKSKYTIIHEGKLLPVTNLFGMDGRDVTNPMHAFQCVVYDKDSTDPKGKWTWMTCEPGEIAPRRLP
jgi:hypothetical protein